MNRVLENYFRYEFGEDSAYVKKDSASLLRNVDAAIFDCDGVLVDIRGSYDRAISETIAYILTRFTGYPFLRDMIDDHTIFLFRRSGGFNNDWDMCYGALMFVLCNLPRELQEVLGKSARDIRSREKAFKRLLLIEKAVIEENVSDALNGTAARNLINQLKAFAGNLDKTGVLSVDRSLRKNTCGSTEEYYEDLRRLLYYPAEVGESIIPTVFEEIFCGADLVREVYGVEPVFHNGQGLIENEQVIVRPETLNRLSLIFGKTNFGIASGSRFMTAQYILGDILSYFHSDALIFLDDVEKEEEKTMETTGKMVNLKKPSSFSLLRASAGLTPFKRVLCVGDSMEDAIMAEDAKKEDPRFMFTGVYRYSGSKNALLRGFLEAGVDVILPSVNEIPFILEESRREAKS